MSLTHYSDQSSRTSARSPWQWLGRLALASGCFVVLYLVLLLAWGTGMPARFFTNVRVGFVASGFTAQRLAEARQLDAADVLLLGSSHAYRGIDPQVLAKALTLPSRAEPIVFNLGTSAQTHLQTAYLIEQYVTHLQPSLVLYEVSPDVMQGYGAASVLDLLLSEGIDLSNTRLTAKHVRLLLRSRDLTALNAYLYRAMAEPLGLWSLKTVRVPEFPEEYSAGGYAAYTGADRYEESMSQALAAVSVEPRQLQALHENVAHLQQLGAQVVLFRAPVPRRVHAQSGEPQEFADLLPAGVPYVDFTGRLPLTDTLDFYDAMHLRPAAVERFSVALGEELRSLRGAGQ